MRALCTYDAFGNVNITFHNGGENTNATKNPFTYRGYYFDQDLGLYYLQSRYYDAKVGRFISADAIGFLGANGDLNSYNLYAYCSNNPVMYTDPNGNFVLSLFIASIALCGVIGGIVGFCATEGDEQDKIEGAVLGVMFGMAIGAIIGTGNVSMITGGISSIANKAVSDAVNVALYGGKTSEWYQYATAFIFGGITAGLGGKAKKGVDIFVRPLVNQAADVVCGDKTLDLEKYCYDVVARAITVNQTKYTITIENNIKIDFGKTFMRTTFSSARNYFLEMLS